MLSNVIIIRVFTKLLNELQRVGRDGGCKPHCLIDQYDHIKAEEGSLDCKARPDCKGTIFKVAYDFKPPRLVYVEEEYLIYTALSALTNIGGRVFFTFGQVPMRCLQLDTVVLRNGLYLHLIDLHQYLLTFVLKKLFSRLTKSIT